jgi:predicted nucleic acid-binding protein
VRDRTWEIFSRFHDKDWGYADCAILAVAREMDVSSVFSFDHHISQMVELTRLPA